MDINFAPPAEFVELAEKTKAFVIDKVIPYEKDPRWTSHGPTDELRIELNELARQAGVFAPHVAKEFGGRGLGQVGRALVFEAAGYSILGPMAVHCASPDEGNIHLLDHVARPDQRQHFLKRMATGQIRSIFCMTEPGGAGSDPGMMTTTARLDGNEWVINGRKWLITGAEGAGCAIIMARNEGGPMDGHATMFLADLPDPAIRIERTLDTMDSSFTGGHGVLEFDNLRLPADSVLGEVGKGFKVAMKVLNSGRTGLGGGCIGGMKKIIELSTKQSKERKQFGKPIADFGLINTSAASATACA